MVFDEKSPISYVVTDPNQTDNPIIMVNDRFLKQTNYPREEVIGRNPRFLQGEKTSKDAKRTLRRAVDKCEEITIDILNFKKTGTPFWFRLRIQPIYSADGHLLHFIGLHSEISSWQVRKLPLMGIRR